MLRFVAFILLVSSQFFGLSAYADSQSSHSNNVVLTLSDPKSGLSSISFDMHALTDFPAITITTSTIWSQGLQEFTGVSLSTFLDELNVTGKSLTTYAANDYSIDIPFSDAIEGGPIIAYLHNGEEMTLRTKGPLRIVYPYDSNPDYQTEIIFARSIWQLERIEVTQ